MKKIILVVALLLSLFVSPAKASACHLANIPSVSPDVSLGFPRSPGRLKTSGVVKYKVLFTKYITSKDLSKKYAKKIFKSINTPYVQEYFKEASYGKLSIKFDPHYVWLPMSQEPINYGFYDIYAPNGREAQASLVKEAMAVSGLDFSGYDGILILSDPTEYFIYHSPAIQYPFSANINNAVVFGSFLSWGYDWESVLIHEIGHNFGLLDLWKNIDTVGEFSIMGNAYSYNGLLGWEKYNLGWIGESSVGCGAGTYKLKPLNDKKGLRMAVYPLSATSAIVVERRKNGGIDENVFGDGIIVYTVNTDRRENPILIQNNIRFLKKGKTLNIEGINIKNNGPSISIGG
jgi:M6 family metalloprotease-like protein